MKNKTNYIKCIITGEKCYCSPDRREKLIKKYGSEQKLEDGYICRTAKTLRKLGVTDSEIKELDKPARKKLIKTLRANKQALKKPRRRRKKLKDENGNPVTHIKFGIPKGSTPCSKGHLSEITKSSCLRPGIFLDNARHCDGCPHYEYCQADFRMTYQDEENLKKQKRKRRKRKKKAKK